MQQMYLSINSISKSKEYTYLNVCLLYTMIRQIFWLAYEICYIAFVLLSVFYLNPVTDKINVLKCCRFALILHVIGKITSN